MQVWKVPAKEHIHQCMAPSEKRTGLVAQVWQENANKPTMTLEEVGELEYQNLLERTEREKKQQEANKEDTDSDKEEVDDRMKKKARNWDNWKDEHEKGAGNRNGR
jgi:immunoglobulin-binding protein 1